MRRGLIAILVTVILWSLGMVLIKLLSNYFSVNVQNFFRYSSASITLLAISRLNIRKILAKEHILEISTAALLIFLFQVLAVTGLYMTTPITFSILLKLNIVFTSILAYILFEEEKKLISSITYLIGTTLASLGAVGFSMQETHSSISLDIGAVLVIISSLIWSLYTIVVKRLVVKGDPLTMTTIVYSIASMLFLPVAFLENFIYQITSVPIEIVVILAISGIISVGIGNWMNFIAIKDIGVSLPTILQLLTPILVGVFSFIILGETISMRTMILGFMVILGCLMIIKKYRGIMY